ncbi:MAG: sirohydrochlorin chelatase [Immundisolibacterales bacterium]|nr:sirohydrochlorin chelatase [Immundisolibacterales bacterium]
MNRIGVMVCGHGSRDVQAITEFESVAAGIRERLPQYDVESGFLEFATPVIREGLEKLRARGNEVCLAVPGMLFAAGHAKNDIPSVLNTYEAGHPEMEIRYARELGIDEKLIRAAGDRIRAALDGAGTTVPLHETMLVVVGRGASDPDANSNVAKVMRLLWEGFGFGWGETAYSGVTFPLVEPGLEHAARLGYRRIVVFPYFLFTGVLVKRIYEHTDRVAARHPEIEFVKAPYLNDHPAVLDAFAERVEETLRGANLMNCKLCKYREQILGFEAEKGLPQESHHHHVEGIGTGTGAGADQQHDHHHDHGHHHDRRLDHEHAHDDGHDHDHGGHGPDHGHGHGHGAHHHHHGHGHGHHPYPHADHPLGPGTLKRSPD